MDRQALARYFERPPPEIVVLFRLDPGGSDQCHAFHASDFLPLNAAKEPFDLGQLTQRGWNMLPHVDLVAAGHKCLHLGLHPHGFVGDALVGLDGKGERVTRLVEQWFEFRVAHVLSSFASRLAEGFLCSNKRINRIARDLKSRIARFHYGTGNSNFALKRRLSMTPVNSLVD